ncbi:MAG: MFS transporter [Minisyncoccia bacterium]
MLEKITEQKNKTNKNVFFVGLLSFFGGISQDIFSPILPLYLTTTLGFDKTFIGIAEGLTSACANIFKVIAGFLSDKFKKQKPIIFFGYFFSMISRSLLAFFTTSTSILGLRFLDGTGKGIKDPPKDVLIAGSSNKNIRGKSFGIARMLDTLGSVAGPLLLFILMYVFQNTHNFYHYILLFSALPLIITLIILITKVKETNDLNFISQQTNTNQSNQYKLPSSFFIFILIIIIFTIGNSSDAFLILRAKNIGINIIDIPLIIALFNLIYALAAVPFGVLSDKIGRIPTLIISWLSYAIVYIGFGIAFHPLLIWFLYGFYGIYYAANEGVAKAFISDLIQPEHRGRAFGIYGTTIGLTSIPASFIAGFLWDHINASMPFYFGSLMSLIAIILIIVFYKKLQPKNIN